MLQLFVVGDFWTCSCHGDLVVATGTVTPEEMQDEELFTGE